MRRKLLSLAAVVLVLVVAGLLLPRNHGDEANVLPKVQRQKVIHLDLSGYDSARPARPLHLLFIHHSCGGQLLAPAGAEVETNAIFSSSANGGGLRAFLEQHGYTVHEAAYGSKVGDKTDVFDWPAKFRNQMEEILACDLQDQPHAGGLRNQVVMFKSCFPNNAFQSRGEPPGNATGPELTLWNAKAAYTSLLPELAKQTQTLFVCLTAPPMAPKAPRQALWKSAAKKLLGRDKQYFQSGPLAREFSGWLASKDGWLKDYPGKNVVVFDLYDVLTDAGASDFSCYATGGGYDSHPSKEGNTKVAQALVPFLNRAVRRAELSL